MSGELMNYLFKNEEMKQLRKKWKEVFPTEGFPPFNYDCYAGIDDYKQKIKECSTLTPLGVFLLLNFKWKEVVK